MGVTAKGYGISFGGNEITLKLTVEEFLLEVMKLL